MLWTIIAWVVGYVVMAGMTGVIIDHACEYDPDAFGAVLFGGALWPIAIPIMIGIKGGKNIIKLLDKE